jgi:hypothetical protein
LFLNFLLQHFWLAGLLSQLSGGPIIPDVVVGDGDEDENEVWESGGGGWKGVGEGDGDEVEVAGGEDEGVGDCGFVVGGWVFWGGRGVD